ncbi:DUF3024 domain-containing protein [Paenibacillus pasadenensis]|uniref:DUF3024 domain-containing protein n=1 Tax=Paenibacillus pasadenensis TaxID=217090 RepID=A0A2N5N8T2_9BACL|nr:MULTISPECIES: DUF3024 domain-containing protein [Paenibacillus]PLT46744.1 hypothetical protein B8V81_0968 [Paenibacillus pasadenensis]
MAIDPFTRFRISRIMEGYAELKVPRPLRDQVRLSSEWDEDCLTLLEWRPAMRGSKPQWEARPIARFRHDGQLWEVQRLDRSGKAWSRVPHISPDADFERQLEQVEHDPDGLFWASLAD